MIKVEKDKGWAFVVLFAACGIQLFTAIFTYGSGVMHLYLLDKYRKDDATTSVIGSLFVNLLSVFEFKIENMMGHIVKLKEEDYLCVEVVGSYNNNTVKLAVSDFCDSATDFSKEVGKPKSTSDFCRFVNKKLEDWSKVTEECSEKSYNEENKERGSQNETFEDNEANPCTTSESLNETMEESEILQNQYALEAKDNFVGGFSVPLRHIKSAGEDRAIRALNPTHLADLYTSFNAKLGHGLQLSFPPATAVIFEEEYQANMEVELIDGNHTHHVMKQLNELHPEREDLQARKVIIYKKLSTGAMSFLGLARNEETTNSLKTSQIEELKIMRNILFHKYGGKYSKKYQDDIYQLFNAVCIGDKKEEEK